jgi:hypothetical protein
LYGAPGVKRVDSFTHGSLLDWEIAPEGTSLQPGVNMDLQEWWVASVSGDGFTYYRLDKTSDVCNKTIIAGGSRGSWLANSLLVPTGASPLGNKSSGLPVTLLNGTTIPDTDLVGFNCTVQYGAVSEYTYSTSGPGTPLEMTLTENGYTGEGVRHRLGMPPQTTRFVRTELFGFLGGSDSSLGGRLAVLV